MGTKDSPVEQHFYAASYVDRTQDVVRLSQPGFSHNVTMNEVLYSCRTHGTRVKCCNKPTNQLLYGDLVA